MTPARNVWTLLAKRIVTRFRWRTLFVIFPVTMFVIWRNWADCYEYNRSALIKPTVINDVTMMRNKSAFSKNDVTIATQMTEDRLHNLHRMMTNWPGPISVSVYINASRIPGLLSRIERRDNVLVHLVIAVGKFYPINYMRNVALNATTTRFVLLNDIDFIPSPGSYRRILDHTKTLGHHQLFVVPAFEELANWTRLGKYFPQNKIDLIRLWNQKKVEPFHQTVYELGHKPTNFLKWASTDLPYQISWSYTFEPYVIGYTNEIPQFNENLVGRYQNKALQIAEMNAMRFTFTVLPDVFLLHLWHPPAPREKHIYLCSARVSEAYLENLEKKYNVLLRE